MLILNEKAVEKPIRSTLATDSCVKIFKMKAGIGSVQPAFFCIITLSKEKCGIMSLT